MTEPKDPHHRGPEPDDMTAEDLAPGTGFEVFVDNEGRFHVTVFYDWSRRSEVYDGVGVGPTWREAAGRAIADAEGEPYEELVDPPEDSMRHPDAAASYAAMLEKTADRFRTGHPQ